MEIIFKKQLSFQKNYLHFRILHEQVPVTFQTSLRDRTIKSSPLQHKLPQIWSKPLPTKSSEGSVLSQVISQISLNDVKNIAGSLSAALVTTAMLATGAALPVVAGGVFLASLLSREVVDAAGSAFITGPQKPHSLVKLAGDFFSGAKYSPQDWNKFTADLWEDTRASFTDALAATTGLGVARFMGTGWMGHPLSQSLSRTFGAATHQGVYQFTSTLPELQNAIHQVSSANDWSALKRYGLNFVVQTAFAGASGHLSEEFTLGNFHSRGARYILNNYCMDFLTNILSSSSQQIIYHRSALTNAMLAQSALFALPGAAINMGSGVVGKLGTYRKVPLREVPGMMANFEPGPPLHAIDYHEKPGPIQGRISLEDLHKELSHLSATGTLEKKHVNALVSFLLGSSPDDRAIVGDALHLIGIDPTFDLGVSRKRLLAELGYRNHVSRLILPQTGIRNQARFQREFLADPDLMNIFSRSPSDPVASALKGAIIRNPEIVSAFLNSRPAARMLSKLYEKMTARPFNPARLTPPQRRDTGYVLNPEYLITSHVAQAKAGHTAKSSTPIELYRRHVDAQTVDAHLKELYHHAETSAPEFKLLMKSLHDEFTAHGIEAVYVPRKSLKSEARSREKILEDYKGETGPLKDVIASRFVVKKTSQLFAMLDHILVHPDVKIIDFEDLIHNPRPSGYRDLNMVLELKNGHRAELQLVLESMLPFDKVEHALYEIRRSLKQGAAEQGRPLSPVEQEIQTVLLDTSWNEYMKYFSLAID